MCSLPYKKLKTTIFLCVFLKYFCIFAYGVDCDFKNHPPKTYQDREIKEPLNQLWENILDTKNCTVNTRQEVMIVLDRLSKSLFRRLEKLIKNSVFPEKNLLIHIIYSSLPKDSSHIESFIKEKGCNLRKTANKLKENNPFSLSKYNLKKELEKSRGIFFSKTLRCHARILTKVKKDKEKIKESLLFIGTPNFYSNSSMESNTETICEYKDYYKETQHINKQFEDFVFDRLCDDVDATEEDNSKIISLSPHQALMITGINEVSGKDVINLLSQKLEGKTGTLFFLVWSISSGYIEKFCQDLVGQNNIDIVINYEDKILEDMEKIENAVRNIPRSSFNGKLRTINGCAHNKVMYFESNKPQEGWLVITSACLSYNAYGKSSNDGNIEQFHVIEGGGLKDEPFEKIINYVKSASKNSQIIPGKY